jgi:hypothetical protein
MVELRLAIQDSMPERMAMSAAELDQALSDADSQSKSAGQLNIRWVEL